jgi:hypothetical protein
LWSFLAGEAGAAISGASFVVLMVGDFCGQKALANENIGERAARPGPFCFAFHYKHRLLVSFCVLDVYSMTGVTLPVYIFHNHFYCDTIVSRGRDVEILRFTKRWAPLKFHRLGASWIIKSERLLLEL